MWQSIPVCMRTAVARDPVDLLLSWGSVRNGPTTNAQLFRLLDTTMALAYHSTMEHAATVRQCLLGPHDPRSVQGYADLVGVQVHAPLEHTA